LLQQHSALVIVGNNSSIIFSEKLNLEKSLEALFY